MVMLSTSFEDPPYLGFPLPFTDTSKNVVETFNEAVDDLGTNGDSTERSFLPILNFLEYNPSFLSDDSFLVLFFLTDEKEQSDKEVEGLSVPTPQNFIDRLVEFKGGAMDQILIYGAFAFGDLQGCRKGQSNAYEGSRYQAIIESSPKNKHFSACTKNFGDEFAKIASDMAEKVFRPQVVTEYKFIPKTLKINIDGVAIEGGEREDAPYWLYDESANIIRFFNLHSLRDDTGELVHIHYQIDDGFDR